MDLLNAAASFSRFIGLAMSYAAVILAGVSVVAAFRRKWLKSRRYARLTAISPAIVAASLLVGGFRFVDEPDTTSRATVLAMTISETMNFTALALLCFVVAVPAWVISARQIRRQRAAVRMPQEPA